MAIIPTAAVIAFKDNSVLLVRHNKGASHLTDTYGLPGGTLQKDETEIQCALREFMEETGLNTNLKDLTEFPGNFFSAEIEKKDGSRHTYPWKVFLCKNFSDVLKSNEETNPEWIDLRGLEDLNLLPNVKKVIENAKIFLKK